MNCYLCIVRNSKISAAVTRMVAAHPAPPCGCSPEGCCYGIRGFPPALLRMLALCSPCTPHPANQPRPGPRLTAPPAHPPAPPRPAAAVPLHLAPPASRAQPHIAQAALPRPGSLKPLRPAQPLSAATVGSHDVSNQQFCRRYAPPRHRRASNSGSVPAQRRTAPPCPIRPFPLLPHVPAGEDKPVPHGAAPAISIPLRPTHRVPPCPPLFPAPEQWGLKTQQKPNAR